VTIWTEHGEPVLRHLAERATFPIQPFQADPSDDPHPELPDLAQRDVLRAIELLHDDGYVKWKNRESWGTGEAMWLDLRVTGRGKQELGDWPRRFEALGEVELLAAIVEELANAAPPEQAENYRRTGKIIRAAETGLQQYATGFLLRILQGELPL
jgi:hypothetical protein